MQYTEQTPKLARNAERQKTYYAEKKEAINIRRREAYAKRKAALQPIEPVTDVVDVVDLGEPLEQSEIIIPKQGELPLPNPLKTKTKRAKKAPLDLAEALSKNIENPNTLKTYNSHLKLLQKIAGDSSLSTFTKNIPELIQKIEDAKKPNGTPYSVNSKKALFELLLVMRDKLGVKMNKKNSSALNRKFDEFKLESVDYNKQSRGQQFGTKLSMPEYLDKVVDTFGEDSKLFVLSNIYKELPIRDDFAVQIVEKMPKDTSGNFIVVPKKKHSVFSITDFKTANKYGSIRHESSPELDKLIRSYIKTNDLKSGDYLFGNQPLSGFVSKANKKMGLKGGINQFRNMSASSIADGTPAKRAEMAGKMRHSVGTAFHYTEGKSI